MKKLTAVSLTLVLACALAGCGADRLTSSVAPPSAAVPSSSAPQESSSVPASSSEKIDSAALLGEWSGDNVYTNEALGLRYVLPEGWVYASEEELLNLLGIVMDSELVDDRTKLALKLDESRVIYAMAAQDPAVGNNVQIVAEDLGSVVGGNMVDEAAYADIVADQQLKSTDTVTSVSYTHLDVYKRQAHKRQRAALGKARGIQPPFVHTRHPGHNTRKLHSVQVDIAKKQLVGVGVAHAAHDVPLKCAALHGEVILREACLAAHVQRSHRHA